MNDDGRWLWSKEKFLQDNEMLEYKNGTLHRKVYFDENDDQNKYQAEKTWLDMFPNRLGAKALSDLQLNGLFDYSKPVGFILYIVLIFFFGYFYTFLQLRPEDVADNLKKNGGYIPGVRPGKETEEYVSHTLSRITIVGTILLIILAIIPIIFTSVTKLPSSISIGGTGLLIVVGVALETYKQLEGSLATRTYKKRKGRLR